MLTEASQLTVIQRLLLTIIIPICNIFTNECNKNSDEEDCILFSCYKLTLCEYTKPFKTAGIILQQVPHHVSQISITTGLANCHSY
jgi:hypothetical protein